MPTAVSGTGNRHFEATNPTIPNGSAVDRRLALALFDRGQLLNAFGRFKDAEADLRACGSSAANVGDPRLEAAVNATLGTVQARLGDVANAKRALAEALDLMNRYADADHNTIMITAHLARLSLEEDELEEAASHANEALALSERFGSQPGCAIAKSVIGLTQVERNPSDARQQLEEGLRDAVEAGHAGGQALALQGLTELALLERRYPDARHHVSELVQLHRGMQGPITGIALAAAARVLLGQEEPERAATLLGLAERVVLEVGAVWPRRSQRLLATWEREVRAAMPEEAFDAAWQEGRDTPFDRSFTL